MEKEFSDLLEKLRGLRLTTPVKTVRVFHISNPAKSFEYVRREGDVVIVVDDNNPACERLREYPANELVNVEEHRKALQKFLRKAELR